MTAKHVLICLTSDQRLQNVLPFFQQGLPFDAGVCLVSSEKGRLNPRYLAVAAALQHALANRAPLEVYPYAVSPVDPEETRKTIGDIIRASPENHFTINYTGGTKPMAVGAYLAGLDADAPLLYVDTQTEHFLFSRRARPIEKQAFAFQDLKTTVYLEAQGRVINQVKTVQGAFSAAEREVARALVRSGRRGVRIGARLHRMAATGGGIPLDLDQSLNQVLTAAGMLDHRILTSGGRRFFKEGIWLEAYARYALEESGHFDDVQSRVSVNLSGREQAAENEIDVLALVNGKLAVIECKHQVGKEGQSILNRLRALRDINTGLFGKAFLVVMKPPSRIGDANRDRAREYGIRIIVQKDLWRLPDIIFQGLTSRARN